MKLDVPIEAVAQGRPRFYKGVAVDPAKSRQFKKEFAQKVSMLRSSSAIYTGELSVELHIYRKMKVTSQRYGDVDNLAKGILDAMTGVLWQDDRQITKLLVTKNFADEPRVELTVEEVR